ncbi:MAG: leucine-rich repeat protein [Candidatus Borkfalkiaceae bacterium]|nr:leucine-rich repeat protein [Clostridia bacterium]MDY6223561.1 leucine-rich repeat protein [Christensenellaceae bacterium]
MKKIKSVILIFALIFAAFFSACSKEGEIAAPQNLTLNVDNELSWDESDQARSYTVEITVAEDATKKQEKNTKRTFLSLAFLETGNYFIRVRAQGGQNNDRFSDWSETIEYRKAYDTGCVYQLINNNSEYEIARVGATTSGTVQLEDVYRGKPVTSIAESAFRGSSKVTGLILGDNIRSIGKNAFYNCANLEFAKLPDSLEEIGTAAFQNCNALTAVNIPDGVIELGESLFEYCYSLEDIEIGKNVETIGQSAFSNCTALKEIVLPDAVKSVGEYAFYSASSAGTLTLGKNTRYLGDSAFYGCSALTKINFYVSPEAGFAGGLKEIGDKAFAGCAALSAVELPDTLETLGNRVFAGDENLESLTIPDGVTRLGAAVIKDTALAERQKDAGYIYADGWLTEIAPAKKQALSDKDAPVDLNPVGDEIKPTRAAEYISEETRGIAASVFSECDGLMNVYLPATVKTVGAYAFASCASLDSVRTRSKSLLRLIDDYAFAGSQNLRVSYFREYQEGGKTKGLETIGAYAFYNCVAVDNNTLYSIIPSTVTRVGKGAYLNTKLWNKAEESGGGVVRAGDWLVGYIEGSDVGTVKLNVSGDDSTKTVGIADYAFMDCSTLAAVTGAADGVKYIGRSAFYQSSLESISLGMNVTEIRDYTFFGCSNLRTIAMPLGLKTIGRSAFYRTSLTRVDLSEAEELESVEDYAFYNSENLTSVDFGNTLKYIGNYAFYKCGNLQQATLPDSVEEIGEGAFRRCTKIASVSFGNGLKIIGKSAFRECPALTEVKFPDSLQSVGAYAFYGDEKINAIEFGGGVEEIGDYAFFGLTELTQATLPASLKSIGEAAFRGCSSLRSAVLSSSVNKIGIHAFYWCDALTFYTDVGSENIDSVWNEFWNSSYRPVFSSCGISEDRTYLVSIVTGNVQNATAIGGIADPYRSGYLFAGWTADAGAGTKEYGTEELTRLPAGITLYAVWVKADSASESA